MNSIRIQYITNQICIDGSEDYGNFPGRYLSGKRFLDVGCGGGLLSESLVRLGADVVAIDPSESLVASAKAHGNMDPRTKSIDYRAGCSVEQLASSNPGSFDAICLLEVLEHIDEPTPVLQAIHSLLKPDGKLFISTLNRTVLSKLVAIVGAEYVMRYLPVGTHDWTKFRSPDEVRTSLAALGLVERDATGMRLDSVPSFGEWNWELDSEAVDINWIATYQKVGRKEDV